MTGTLTPGVNMSVNFNPLALLKLFGLVKDLTCLSENVLIYS